MTSRTALIACSLAGGALALAACGSSSSSSSGASSSGGAGSSSAAAAGGDYCSLAHQLQTTSQNFGGITQTSDVNSIKALVSQFASEVDAAAAAAPSSISADWNVLKTAYDGAVGAVAGAKTTTDAITALGTKFTTPAVETAGKNVDNGTKAACGFTISNSSSGSSSGSSSSSSTDTGSSSSTDTGSSSSTETSSSSS